MAQSENEADQARELVEQVNREIEELREQFEDNDKEMRRQIENANRQIAKYKLKIRGLKDEKKMEPIVEKEDNKQVDRSHDNLAQENLVLIQRL